VFGTHYEPLTLPHITSGRVRTDPQGISLTIWSPEIGVGDHHAFTRNIEQQWQILVRELDNILDRSVPMIQGAIASFWLIPDEPPPTASALLKTGLLRHINLGTFDSASELHIYDDGELIGGHDLIIELDHRWNPTEAWFDG
jgi:hypothetical protein